jgi:hypothetical protein
MGNHVVGSRKGRGTKEMFMTLSPLLFLVSKLPGSWWVHVLISPHVYTILPCINIIYLTAFSCPSKLFSFGSNIDRELHILQQTGHEKVCY